MIIAVNEAMIENSQGGQSATIHFSQLLRKLTMMVIVCFFPAYSEADHDGHSVFFLPTLKLACGHPDDLVRVHTELITRFNRASKICVSSTKSEQFFLTVKRWCQKCIIVS